MDERHEITDALRKLAGNRTDAEVPYHSSIEAMRLIGIINRDRPDNITDIE